jgi:hypothetical protein
MAAPATTWPTFDVAEIAEEAAERSGIEFRSGYALRTARRALELLSIEWANRGLNLWTLEGPVVQILQSGVAEYPLSDDTIDIVEQVVRDPQGAASIGQATDYKIERFSLPEYAAITNKMAPGRPTMIHVRRLIPPYFILWMVPPVGSNFQLVYWRLRRMAGLGSGGTGVPEIPWRFTNAMIAGLAFYLALKSKDPGAVQRLEVLKSEYQEQFQLASDEDRDRAAYRFIPGGYEFV